MNADDVTIAECYFDAGPKWWEARCVHCGAMLDGQQGSPEDARLAASRSPHECPGLRTMGRLDRIIELLERLQPPVLGRAGGWPRDPDGCYHDWTGRSGTAACIKCGSPMEGG